MNPVLDHLRALDPAGVRDLLEARPDLVLGLEPESLSELAERVEATYSVAEATGQVNATTRAVLEALVALRLLDPDAPGVTRDRLGRLLDAASGRRADLLAAALDEAVRLVLVLPVRAATSAESYLPVGGLLDQWDAPLNLAPPAAILLADTTSADLRRIATTLGLAPARRKPELLAQIVEVLGDAEQVRSLVTTAPAAVRAELLARAVDGAPIDRYAVYGAPGHRHEWAQDRGLLVRSSWGGVLQIPGEVALALRGPAYRAPLRLPPPDPTAGIVDAATLAADGSAGVLALLGAVERLLDLCARTPPKTIKTGRVGVREIRRLAKALDLDEDTTADWIEVAAAAELLAAQDGVVLPTPQADAWRAASPAERVSTVLLAWVRRQHHREMPWVVLSYLAGQPEGVAVGGAEPLGEYLAWRYPLTRMEAPEDPESVEDFDRALTTTVDGAMHRLARLALVARGAATALGRTLVTPGGPDPAELVAVAEKLTPSLVTTATFQSDLTALVAGMPAASLAGVLDRGGRLEGRGTASTWRFDAASIRAAMNAGESAEDLLAALREVSAGPLPQALEYLVKDVARKHGAARVAPVGSCVTSDDVALLAEMRVTRALAPLRFRALAPTVLASPAGPDEVLDALRKAGFAPARADEAGDIVLEPRDRQRAAAPVTQPPRAGTPAVDLDALAAHLVATPTGPTPIADHTPRTLFQLQAADGLTLAGKRVLAHAIDQGQPVEIDYVTTSGNRTSRVVEDLQLDGPLLHAWCRLRDDERVFALARILAVRPA